MDKTGVIILLCLLDVLFSFSDFLYWKWFRFSLRLKLQASSFEKENVFSDFTYHLAKMTWVNFKMADINHPLSFHRWIFFFFLLFPTGKQCFRFFIFFFFFFYIFFILFFFLFSKIFFIIVTKRINHLFKK